MRVDMGQAAVGSEAEVLLPDPRPNATNPRSPKWTPLL